MAERAHSFLEGAGRFAAILAGYALLGLSIAICAEILLRRFSGLSLQGTDEVGGYVLAGASAFGFAYALLHHGHTRIDLLLRRVPPGAQAALNLFSAALFALIACSMAWRAFATLQRSLELGAVAPTPLQTPIWIPQGIWVAGLCFFALVAIYHLLLGLTALRRGARFTNSLIGPISLDQEIEEEISQSTSSRDRPDFHATRSAHEDSNQP